MQGGGKRRWSGTSRTLPCSGQGNVGLSLHRDKGRAKPSPGGTAPKRGVCRHKDQGLHEVFVWDLAVVLTASSVNWTEPPAARLHKICLSSKVSFAVCWDSETTFYQRKRTVSERGVQLCLYETWSWETK